MGNEEREEAMRELRRKMWKGYKRTNTQKWGKKVCEWGDISSLTGSRLRKKSNEEWETNSFYSFYSLFQITKRMWGEFGILFQRRHLPSCGRHDESYLPFYLSPRWWREERFLRSDGSWWVSEWGKRKGRKSLCFIRANESGVVSSDEICLPPSFIRSSCSLCPLFHSLISHSLLSLKHKCRGDHQNNRHRHHHLSRRHQGREGESSSSSGLPESQADTKLRSG